MRTGVRRRSKVVSLDRIIAHKPTARRGETGKGALLGFGCHMGEWQMGLRILQHSVCLAQEQIVIVPARCNFG